MKVSILGGIEMAGHVMEEYFGRKSENEIHYTSRDVNYEQSFFLHVTGFKRLEEIAQAIKPNISVTTLEFAKAAEEMLKKKVKIIPEYHIVLDRTIKNTSTGFQDRMPAYREMFIHFKRMDRKRL